MILRLESGHLLQKFWKNSQKCIFLWKMTVNFFRIFWVNMRLRQIFKIFDRVSRWRFYGLDNVLKHSKIFLRRTLVPKILKNFMVIYAANVHVCKCFQNVWSYCALGKKNNWGSKLPIFKKFTDMQLPEFENS